MTERLHFHFSLSCIGEGNGNPLQCFCLENPRDRGAWWAAIYRVAQSWTRLKRLSSSSSRLLHLPLHKKVKNSSTWDICFSLINNNLLMFRLPALCCKTSVYPGSPPHFLRTVLSRLLVLPPPGLKSEKFPTNKI